MVGFGLHLPPTEEQAAVLQQWEAHAQARRAELTKQTLNKGMQVRAHPGNLPVCCCVLPVHMCVVHVCANALYFMLVYVIRLLVCSVCASVRACAGAPLFASAGL